MFPTFTFDQASQSFHVKQVRFRWTKFVMTRILLNKSNLS